MRTYHCSIYQIGAGLRPNARGERVRRAVDPVKRLNAIARWWKSWSGESRVFTWLGYRSEVKAVVSAANRYEADMREYE